MTTDNQEDFSSWLRVQLEQHGFTQSHAANSIGIAQSTFNTYCTGRQRCQGEHKEKIVRFFKGLKSTRTALAVQAAEDKQASLEAATHVPGLDEILDRGIVQAIIAQTATTLGVEPGALIYQNAALFRNCEKRGVSMETLVKVVMSMVVPKS